MGADANGIVFASSVRAGLATVLVSFSSFRIFQAGRRERVAPARARTS
jgi:hypothetical protein